MAKKRRKLPPETARQNTSSKDRKEVRKIIARGTNKDGVKNMIKNLRRGQ